MPIVIVEAVAPIASWRPPEALTFHPTYPLPPYTAQVGTLAAALGMNLQDGYRFVADNELAFGVGGWSEGRLRDLWKFQKLKDNGVLSAVILREHLVDMRLCFVIRSKSSPVAENVANAFRSPRYPLTAGQSDSLLHAVRVSVCGESPVKTNVVQNTLIYSEVSPDYKLAEDLDEIPLSQSIVAPSVQRIATGFNFDDDGHRSLASRSTVTFVGNSIEVVEPISGYRVDPTSRFFQSRDLRSWTIPVAHYN